MSIRNIVLAVNGGVVLVAILVLWVKVQAAPAPADSRKVQQGLQAYQRTHTAPPTPSSVEDPWARKSDGSGGISNDGAGSPPLPSPTRVTPKLGMDPSEVAAEPPTPAEASTPDVANDPRLDAMSAKDEANRLYDKQDYEGAMNRALEVLKSEPGDIRMLRVVVSSACQLGDADKARTYWAQLPPHDQNQMMRRCQRFGITFTEQ